jgi:hypothetical protein
MGEDDNEVSVEQQVTWELFTLCINIGIIASVMPQYPAHVQENWREKLSMLTAYAGQQIEEIQAFGEAYDEAEEEDNIG